MMTGCTANGATIALQFRMATLIRLPKCKLTMYAGGHHPPHFHAVYGEFEVEVAIARLEVLEGRLPSRALGLTIEWAAQHQDELLVDWELASTRQPLYTIAPLR